MIEIEQDGELRVMRNISWIGLAIISVVVIGSIWALSQLVER